MISGKLIYILFHQKLFYSQRIKQLLCSDCQRQSRTQKKIKYWIVILRSDFEAFSTHSLNEPSDLSNR